MKRVVTIVALMCAVAFQVKAQSSVEQQLKKAEEKAELADKNPTDGKLQYQAALEFFRDDLGDKKDLDRALTYANRALKIAQEQTVLKDTLLGLTYYTLGVIYIFKQDTEKVFDNMEKAMDAFQKELGRYDPVTIGTKLIYGNAMIQYLPFRAYPKVLDAFYDNYMTPKDKQIENMDEANIMEEMAIENLIYSYTDRFRYALPMIMYEGQRHLIVQTPDWNMERPLVGWCLPKMMRTEEEDKAFKGDDIILCDEKTKFKVIPFEEKAKIQITYHFTHQLKDPRHLLFNENDTRILFFNPDNYQEILTRFREFKNKK